MQRARLVSLALIALAILGSVTPAYAVSTKGIVRNVHYVAAFFPSNSFSYPYSGELVLTFNNGIVSGWYNDYSVKPGGPLDGRSKAVVTGGLSGTHVMLSIGGVLSLSGTIEGGMIEGTATARGAVYQFFAEQRRSH